MLELNLSKNNNQKSTQYGKWYARVDLKESYDIPRLAEHMADHNTPFSAGTIQAILIDAVKCIRELTLNGNTVKIDNLAIFKCSVNANAIEEANLGTASASVGKAGTSAAVRAVKMTAQATGSYSKAALTSDAKLGWTKYAEENQINPAKEAAENAGGEEAGV